MVFTRDYHVIRSIEPSDGDLINYLYNIIYRLGTDLTFNEFKSCIGDMYIYTDECGLYSQEPKVYGIIAAKREKAKNKRYTEVNIIKVFHIFRYVDESIYEDIAYHLLRVLTIDNNDIPIEFYIPRNNDFFDHYISKLEIEFTKNDFAIKLIDDKSITYIRYPVIN